MPTGVMGNAPEVKGDPVESGGIPVELSVNVPWIDMIPGVDLLTLREWGCLIGDAACYHLLPKAIGSPAAIRKLLHILDDAKET